MKKIRALKLAPWRNRADQSGFALVAAVVILLLITVIGLALSSTSFINRLIANHDKSAKQVLYDQDYCVGKAFNSSSDWMTDTFLAATTSAAAFPNTSSTAAEVANAQCYAPDDTTTTYPIGSYRVRKLSDTEEDISTWRDSSRWTDDSGTVDASKHPANSYPHVAYKSKPPVGSGFDQTNWVVRKFVITSYSDDKRKNTVVQKGVYKAFNNY